MKRVSQQQIAKIREEMRVILESTGLEPRHALGEESYGDRDVVVSVTGSQRGDRGVVVRDGHRSLLESILKHPFRSTNEHSEAMGNVSPALMKRIKDQLESIGYIQHALTSSLGRRGNPRQYLRITEEGAAFLNVDLKQHRYPGKGEFEHCLFQHLIWQHLAGQNRKAIIELNLDGKSVDVGEFTQDRRIRAYEVELRVIQHAVENITKDLECGCQEVVVVTRNRAEQERIRTLVYGELPSDKLGQVEFKTIAEFVK
jgi:hypothetical protein